MTPDSVGVMTPTDDLAEIARLAEAHGCDVENEDTGKTLACRDCVTTAEKDQAREFAFVDRETHEPCPTRLNVGGGVILCAITDPAHRHMAAHMVPRMALTVAPGEKPVSALGMVEALDRAIPPGERCHDIR